MKNDKKTIFDLTRKEGRELEKKVWKASYYRQYFLIFITTIMMLSFVGGFIIGGILSIESEWSLLSAYISAVILFGFTCIMVMQYSFKRFDLIKKYFEENKK